MILIFAPDGIEEVRAGADLAGLVVAAVERDPLGPLVAGDIVVVTSKIVSKAEGRSRPAAERDAAIRAETVATVARRGATRIVRTVSGLSLAAAGVDNSNVATTEVLLLPVDPDASAARLRLELSDRTGGPVGVIISDTAGRPWRLGQTDQAIGTAGVRVLADYAGRRDGYGNELVVTAPALADELASAADLVKEKLAGRPVAVIRGLGSLLAEDAGSAADLVRPLAQDMFARGTREAVLAAVCAATGQSGAYEQFCALEGQELADAVVAGSGRTGGEAALLRAVLTASAYPTL